MKSIRYELDDNLHNAILFLQSFLKKGCAPWKVHHYFLFKMSYPNKVSKCERELKKIPLLDALPT